MKSVLTLILFCLVLSGCKGYIGDSTVVSEIGSKKCTLINVIAPDLVIEFNLIDSNYKSQNIILNGTEIVTECNFNHDCKRPYYIREKGANNLIEYLIFDKQYSDQTDVNIKLVTTYPDDSVVTINRENEPLDWVATMHSNCQETKTADVEISE